MDEWLSFAHATERVFKGVVSNDRHTMFQPQIVLTGNPIRSFGNG
jgi:hypothetical protein